MLLLTKEILDIALSNDDGKTPANERVHAAYGSSMGFGSTDSLSAMVLDELHSLGFILDHTIEPQTYSV